MSITEVYIVTGTTESVEQTRVGGPFEKFYSKESVAAFSTRKAAEEFVESQRLSKPVKRSFSGLKNFKGGFYEMEIDTLTVNFPS